MNFTSSLKAARRVSTPLIAVKTPDQAMTIETIQRACTNGKIPPILTWDCIRGCQWLNDPGLYVCWTVLLQKENNPIPTRADDLERARKELAMATGDLTLTLEQANSFPADTVLILQNAQMFWDKPAVVQAAWNLRDTFKANFRTLIMLTDAGATVPSGLRDALPLSQELPTLDELEAIVNELCGTVDVKLDKTQTAQAVDAICGLPAFSAEQAVAMSFVKRDGQLVLDTDLLWERKRQVIEQTPGLSVWRGADNFSGLGGLDNIKTFMLDVLRGEQPPRVIVFMDEIEKAFAGASGDGGGDSSGTTQEMHGTLLSEMQNREYTGAIIVGPPGTGKSALAKALAGEAKRPCIILDLSSMKSKFVGSSNENLNTALAVINSVSQGQALFIATCNAVAQLPPELKRRFTLGVFFMDLPSASEREAIWQVYLAKYKLNPKQDRPADEGWTGADIKQACNLAWRLKKPLTYVQDFLTPIAQTDAARISKLREDSSGKYLSASYEGKYTYERNAASVPAPTNKKRNIRVE